MEAPALASCKKAGSYLQTVLLESNGSAAGFSSPVVVSQKKQRGPIRKLKINSRLRQLTH